MTFTLASMPRSTITMFTKWRRLGTLTWYGSGTFLSSRGIGGFRNDLNVFRLLGELQSGPRTMRTKLPPWPLTSFTKAQSSGFGISPLRRSAFGLVYTRAPVVLGWWVCILSRASVRPTFILLCFRTYDAALLSLWGYCQYCIPHGVYR